MFTNQEHIYNALLELISPLGSTKVLSMSGKPGVGKTFVINLLINALESKYNCPICYVKGDEFCKDRDYYCIKQALNQLTHKYEKSKNAKNIAIKAGEIVPQWGSLISHLLSNKLNHREIMQKQNSFFLSEEELDIIYRLNYVFDKRFSIIICDDLQYFDNKTLELIYIMISSKEKIFDFFKNCKFLLVHTDLDQMLSPIVCNILTEKCEKKLRMPPFKYEDMDSILRELGCNIVLDEKIKKILFNLSDGHLEIIKQISSQLRNSKTLIEIDTDINDVNNFLENLVSKKLSQMGANGEQISTLLEYASLIGKTFSNTELSMSLDLNKQEFCNAIQKSNQLEFISSREKYSDFTHDIIHLLFRKRADKKLIFYYEKMRECVKILTPSEYPHRIDIERNLGNFSEAAVLIVLWCAKNNYNIEFTDSTYTQILALCPNIKDFLYDMNMAYGEYQKKNYLKTLSLLNSIDEFLPIQLVAEKNLLKSITLTKSLNDNQRQEAISCLEEYTLERLNNEGDLFLRIQLALISSYTHMSELEKARQCEKRIMNYLVSKIDYEPNAYTVINILHRKANSIYECIYAERYIRKSVEYFAPLQNQSAPLNPIQYLMSLGNHAGILIECGRFQESCNVSIIAQNMVKENGDSFFPRTHIIDNNYLLALYLSNSSVKRQVLQAYEELIYAEEYADNIFILANYGALLAVNGCHKEALDILEKTIMISHNNREAFYEICVDNNLLVLKLFYKDYESAQIILDRLTTHIDGIVDESYYRKKYELFQHVIDEKMNIPIEKIDTFLFELCESYQEAWNYWGRSFDYTALYYWSDM